MKKVLLPLSFAVLLISTISSCRKDYECVSNSGYAYDTCNNCRSRGVVKVAFDTNCTFEGGTVRVK